MTVQQSTLTAVVFSEPGMGKSRLGGTAPAPRVILDAENGSAFLPGSKVIWDPMAYAPPGVRGCAPGQEQVPETTRVLVRDWQTFQRALAVLESGQHFFRSAVLDSLTEIQKRCRDDLRGTEAMQQQTWGELLIQMESSVRRLRDLTMMPQFPLRNIIVTAIVDDARGAKRPYVQGALSKTLSQFFDVQGFLYTEPVVGADGQTFHARRMLIQPWNMPPPVGQVVAKDRTDVLSYFFGAVVPIKDLRIPNTGYDLLDMVALIEQTLYPAVAAPAETAQLTSGGNA